jgi:YD repeat-containing protein
MHDDMKYMSFDNGFFKRNFPNGLDLDQYKISGSYNYNFAKDFYDCFVLSQREFDSAGNRIKEIHSNKHVSHWEYDELGRVVRYNSTICPGLVNYIYDGNLTKMISSNGMIDQCEYNDQGKLIKHTFPGIETLHRYNKQNQLIETIEVYCKKTLTWKYRYNKQKEISSMLYPNGKIRSFKYDKYGNKIKEVYLTGKVYRWEYDERRNIIKEILPNNIIKQWEFTYDENQMLINIKRNSKNVFKTEKI